MYRHFFWDFDGTLFDTYPAITIAFQRTLESYGIPESYDKLYALIKISMGHAFEHYRRQGRIDDHFTARYREIRDVVEADAIVIYPFAREICTAVVQSGGCNYLITHRGASAFDILRRHGLYDLFTDFTTKDSGFARKPSPEAIEYILHKYSICAEEAIMIGDRELDIEAGRSAGIASCFFDSDSTGQPSSADYYITSLEEIKAMIKSTQ